MIKPKISIVLPTYNRAKTISKSIESVLNQTYTNIELIIVDDGSNDNTSKIVEKFQKLDSRIILIRHKKNLGANVARNTGIKRITGQFIAFQDSDDIWLKNKLEKQIDILVKSSSEIGVVYTGYWRIIGNKKIYFPPNNISEIDDNIHRTLLKINLVGTPTALVKPECFEKVGLFDENLSIFQDWELWIRISKYYKFKIIHEPLVIAYYQKDSIGLTENSFKGFFMIFKKHYKEYISHPFIIFQMISEFIIRKIS
jgi:glycosyltransferase involved in cell wall biosynthesis